MPHKTHRIGFSGLLTCLILCLSACEDKPDRIMIPGRVYGGSEMELGAAARETADGGFIVVGSTRSYGAGSFNIWVVKTDADSGYILVGSTSLERADSEDIWLIKTDAEGYPEWETENIIASGMWPKCLFCTGVQNLRITRFQDNNRANEPGQLALRIEMTS